MSGSTIQKVVEICHIEIPAGDLSMAKEFYSAVFGWYVQEDYPGSDYWFFKAGNVGGAFSSSRRNSDDGVCLILSVDDIPRTLEMIAASGGEKLSLKSALPNGLGFVASFRDPNGVKMELWSRT